MISFSFFGVTVFFGLGFESPTGVSGTVAALAASLLKRVVFGTSWIKFEVNKSYMYIKHTNRKESSQGKSCPK